MTDRYYTHGHLNARWHTNKPESSRGCTRTTLRDRFSGRARASECSRGSDRAFSVSPCIVVPLCVIKVSQGWWHAHNFILSALSGIWRHRESIQLTLRASEVYCVQARLNTHLQSLYWVETTNHRSFLYPNLSSQTRYDLQFYIYYSFSSQFYKLST